MLALFTGVVTSAMGEELERTVKREVWSICFSSQLIMLCRNVKEKLN
jgi:hypothetical protein